METQEELFVCKFLPLLSPCEFAKIAYRQFGASGLATEYFRQVIEYLNKEPSIFAQEGNKNNKKNLTNSAPSAPTIADMNAKFLADKSNFVLKYGGKKDFIKGLESYIGRPKTPHILHHMKEEHNSASTSLVEFSPSNNQQLVTTPAEEWLFVVNPREYRQAAAKNRRTLPRNAVSIEELMRHEACTKANLEEAEVVAARLYTGPMFKLYNDLLRNPPGPGNQAFVYTIHAFASCIVKLSRVPHITTLYRGMKGGALPLSFLEPDEYGARGGVEYGFMSTTTVKDVAYDYATGGPASNQGQGQRAALIYEIDEGAIDRGADVSWLSQFPTENEVVFPPCTNLEVLGQPRVVDGAIVTKLRVNINLRILTVDEIVAKSRTQFLHMLDWYMEEVRTAALDFFPTEVLPTWLDDLNAFKESMEKKDGASFNQHEFYRKAVDEALDLKEGTVQKVRVLKVLCEMDVGSLGADNTLVFGRTVARLRGPHASRFADPRFVMRYVDPVHGGARDQGGHVQLRNYDLLWSLRVENGAWSSLVRGGTSVAPVRVKSPKTWAQRIRDAFFHFAFVKGLWRRILGNVAMDKLLGFDGVYYCIGSSSEDGKPLYQLSKSEGHLSMKYMYCKGGRWHVGSVLGSESADLRALSEGEALPTEVRRWGASSAPVPREYLTSQIRYQLDERVQVVSERDACQCGDVDEEAVTINALSPGWGTTAPYTERSIETVSLEAQTRAGAGAGGPSGIRIAMGVKSVDNSATFDSQKLAFIHRLIEIEEHLQREQEKEQEEVREQERGGSRAVVATPSGGLSKSELHSVSVYCQQSGCPQPKNVSAALRQESSKRVIVFVAFLVSFVAWFVTCLVLGLSDFGLVNVGNFAFLGWFLRGWWLGFVIVVVVAVCALIFAVLGPSWASASGITSYVLINSAITYSIYVATDVDADPTIRGIATFSDIGVAGFLLVSMTAGFLLR